MNGAGWNIVSHDEYVPLDTSAVKEALMQGNTESDYLLFVDNKAIAVIEAKREDYPLGTDVADQAEGYATHPQNYETEGLQTDGSLIVSYYDSASDFYGGDVEVIYILDPENTELLREYLSEKSYGSVESMFYQECSWNCMKKARQNCSRRLV